MRSSVSKVVALAAAGALALAACSSDKSSKGAANETSADGKVVIDTFTPSDSSTNLTTNAVTKIVSDKFKIQFRWQTTTYDAGPAKEKRQIALASGDYPDLYASYKHVLAHDPALKVHLYGKAVRPGRKIGHVTVCGDDLADLRERARHAADYIQGVVTE